MEGWPWCRKAPGAHRRNPQDVIACEVDSERVAPGHGFVVARVTVGDDEFRMIKGRLLVTDPFVGQADQKVEKRLSQAGVKA